MNNIIKISPKVSLQYRRIKVSPDVSLQYRRIKVLQRVYLTYNRTKTSHIHVFLDNGEHLTTQRSVPDSAIKDIFLKQTQKLELGKLPYLQKIKFQNLECNVLPKSIDIENYYNLNYLQKIIHDEKMNMDIYVLPHNKYYYRYDYMDEFNNVTDDNRYDDRYDVNVKMMYEIRHVSSFIVKSNPDEVIGDAKEKY